HEAPYLGTYYYLLNTAKPPLSNKLVRQALNLAIDRDRLVRLVIKGGQHPAQAFTPPGTGGFTPIPRLPADSSQVNKARELLAKAGFPGGKGFPRLEILYNTETNHKNIAEAIQAMWKENLGIEVGMYNQEWKVYLDSRRTMNYQIARAGWIADYNDPDNFLNLWVTNGGNNQTGFSNKGYDSLILASAKERNPKKRHAIFQKLEDILLDELPIIPIYIYTRPYLKEPAVQGWYDNVEDTHVLKFISVSAKP
ncbi:MAG: peptide ABC transporter substrate-binding protein, partial [Deltaproteobacteria bacterium]|nr:peptide ABC transporter substrate-binding protein [Deltaproteobacteria bacterium]